MGCGCKRRGVLIHRATKNLSSGDLSKSFEDVRRVGQTVRKDVQSATNLAKMRLFRGR